MTMDITTVVEGITPSTMSCIRFGVVCVWFSIVRLPLLLTVAVAVCFFVVRWLSRKKDLMLLPLMIDVFFLLFLNCSLCVVVLGLSTTRLLID